MNAFISPDNTWLLASIMLLAVSVSIYLEHTYMWASKISGAVIAIILAVVLVNCRIIPTHAPIFDDVVWGYAVPIAIPLLLLQANLSKIWRETGRLFFIFLIGAVGTVVGAVLATILLQSSIEDLPKVAAMMTGSYIGGGVNFVALADVFKPHSTIISSTIVADNLNMAIYFLILLAIVGNAFFRRHYLHPHIQEVQQKGISKDGITQAAAYWSRRDISLKDIAFNITYAVLVVTLSKAVGTFLGSAIPTDSGVLHMCNTFFGSQYVWITIISMIFATCCEKQIAYMNGAQEIGTFFIYLFFFAIGVPASVMEIIFNAPFLFVFCLIIVVVNMLFCFVGGKLFHFSLEEIVLASNANIGGPTTAAGMAISQGWIRLIGPCMLVGTFGYVIGTYLGIIVGSILGAG